MEKKIAGRFTVIALVLFVGLFGIPFIGGAIFSLGKLFDPSVPWSRKHNLKPGIDISGGTSLIYEISVGPDTIVDEQLSQRVADALKRRVDPDGVKNLVWRPQGPQRLEIQMPLTPGSQSAAEVRKAFSKAQEELEATNVRAAEVRAAVQLTDLAKRQANLERLAMGSAKRKAIFERMSQAMKEVAEADKQNDPVKARVEGRKALEAAERDLLATNLPPNRVQTELELLSASIEEARKGKTQVALDQKLKERELKVAELKAEADFPARQKALESFIARFDEYMKVKGTVDDAEDLKRLLRGSGVLEFHITVNDPTVIASAKDRLREEGPAPRPGDTARWYEIDKVDDRTVQEAKIPSSAVASYADKFWMLCYTTPDESMIHSPGAKPWGLAHAARDFDPRKGEPVVAFRFDPQGSVLFGDLTGRNKGRQLAIVLDDKLINAPNINERIEGSGIISGNYSNAELEYLIRTLTAGSLPARLADEPISERTIGPQLGADNLRTGLISCLWGIIIVAIFMIGYYYLAGLVAVIAVLMNLVLIIGILAMFSATFTLPGIAALVLTIGMAVDANVLIFERLREEQLKGLSLRLALRNAYDRAFSAIFDSNLTTIATSLVLYYFGSEEVKGFGLTLAIGVTSSLFTSLYVTRTIFDLLLERGWVKKLGSLPLTFPNWDRALKPNIDWMGKAWAFYGFSAIIIAGGLLAFWSKGRDMFDIEFVSGTAVQFQLKDPMELNKVRELIQKPEFEKELPAAQPVAIGNTNEDYEVVTPNVNAQEVRGALLRALGPYLELDLPSTFEQSGADFELAANKSVLPVGIEPITVDGVVGSGNLQHQGGVAIVLRNLEPALTPAQIQDRIDRLRLDPTGKYAPRRVEVEPKQSDQPTKTAIVYMSMDEVDHEKDPAVWRDQLAYNSWDLVKQAIGQPPQLRRVTNINAQVAGDTKDDAVMAIVLSIIIIAAYIWVRFGNLKYGTATVVALLHDVLVTVAVIGLSHYVANWSFTRDFLLIEPFRINLTMVAAILTVMGYSVNDTIIVFDRIRENRGKFGHVNRQVINDSINQTLSRTLLTGGTTIATLFIMYTTGGPSIHGFTFALLAGILVGTYSSIAIASPILLLGGQREEAADRSPPIGQLQRAGG